MNMISERHKETSVIYSLNFEYPGEKGCGFSFPCDKDSNLLPDMNECALENYAKCINGTYNVAPMGIKKITHSWIEPAVGICDICKKEVSLVDEYCGACECECGQWYNMNGQQLLPPKYWEK